MEVALVYWPAEAGRLAQLRARGEPRLVIVDHEDPPICANALEDWVRTPVDDDDLRIRLAVLRERAARRCDAIVIDDGVLRCRDRLVVLPPTEARLAGALLRRLDAVVPRDLLTRSAWPERPPLGRNALDVHIAHLRRLVDGTGVDIRTVYRRGYLMHVDPQLAG